MEKLSVRSSTHLVNDGGLQVNHHATWHVFPSTRLAEEGVEGVIATSDGLVTWHLTIWLDTVLETEQLPARVSDLHARLANMDANALAHGCCLSQLSWKRKVYSRTFRVM